MLEAHPSPVTIRRAVSRDEKRWRELFDGYCVFYKRTPSEPLTRHTWERIMDDASSIHAIVAEDQGGDVIGIANYVIHEHTLGLTPVCYFGDLFVDPTEPRDRGRRTADRLAGGRNEAQGLVQTLLAYQAEQLSRPRSV